MAKEHPDLYKKVLRGGFWVFALRIFTQVLSMLRLVVLARLLAPEDFGLMGIALLLISILQTFTETGFNAALIQKQTDITPYLNTAWTVNIARGLLLYIVLFFAAPFAANIKIPTEQIPTAIAIIRVAGLAVIIGSLSNIGTVYFQKELNFNKTFVLTSVSNLIGIVASIIVAIIYKSPWALVVGKLFNTSISALMSYKLHHYRPKLQFNYSKFLELWRFGRWMMQNSILYFIMTHGDDILVWVMLGVTELAYYQMAYKLATTATYEIVDIVNKIVFPAFSKMASDVNRLKKAYFKTSKLLVSVNVVIVVLMVVFCREFVLLAVGEKWLAIVPVIQILAVRCVVNSIGALRGPLWLSMGKPQLVAKFKYIRVALLAIIIYPLTSAYGILGAAVAISLVSLAVQIPEAVTTSHVLKQKTFL